MKKKVIISGGTGLLGQRLVDMLDKEKYDIHILSRSDHRDKEAVSYIKWDTTRQLIEPGQMEGTDVIINLAGAGIADERWTDKRKKVILDSRTQATATLGKAISEMKNKPALFIGASAIGYYGDRGNEVLTETSRPGENFLAEVCTQWEQATIEASGMCDRSVIMRIGIVLSSKGGALAEILKTTKTGVYGYFGNGETYYSWIHIDDLCRMFIEAMENTAWDGAYNGTSREPVSIKNLVKAVRSAKNGFGPLVPVPAFALRLGMGEMADMLLASMRVLPQRAIEEGFSFGFSSAEDAIRDILDRKL